ncbi:hypothetical protein JAAARDRAFT_358342 [Jaapia argillacea MUCL 33604]|uniref:F-box domain-containing protein n=1 Tax=Jaapia argillacea MUCL 33604 TaxID=933084 RepID=A0A067QH69_9AGAM|nr:hypothetical protein JAAARDRAFT_358342 [Jaapia argillacea MUCL 33604]
MDASLNTLSQQLQGAMRCYEASIFDALPICDFDSTVELTQGVKSLIFACVTEVTHHIRKMESLLRAVEEDRERSRGHSLDRINTLVSPTHHLPPEILSRIFFHCYDKYVSLDRTLLHLLLVCKHWRNVALSTPLLWSSIGVEPSHSLSFREVRRLKSALRTFLQRSGTTSISLHLDIGSFWSASDLLTDILPHLHRCKFIDLNSMSIPDNMGFISRIAKEAISLESFSFSVLCHGFVDYQSIAFQSPHLRHVTAYGLHTSSFPLPWAQLTHLHLGNQSEYLPFNTRVSSCFDVLRQCVELTDFSFYMLDYRPPPTLHDSAPIVLPKLRCLHMQGSSSDSLLLERLVAPKLTNVTYLPMSPFLRYRCYFAPARAFRRCIEQSGCNLQCLSIRPGHASWNEVIDWLLCVPSLSELRLEFRHRSVHSRKHYFKLSPSHLHYRDTPGPPLYLDSEGYI